MLAPIILLGAIGAGVLYVRLLNGPVSLKSFADPIARAIEADLEGFGVSVGDAAVQMTKANGLEFRLQDVRLSDREGAPVALAPLAAVRLSMNALWSGRIAPERVVLIEPRLLLLYSRELGLALSFARPSQAAEQTGQEANATSAARSQAAMRESLAARPPGTSPAVAIQAGPLQAGPLQAGPLQAGAGKAIDMGRTIARLATRSQTSTTTSFLKQVGLRNATLIFDNAGRQAFWRVAEAEFGFNHRQQGSVIGGNMLLATTAGRWQLTFSAREDQGAGAIGLDAKISNFVPRSIADTLPEFAPLATLDLPVDGTAKLVLSHGGELTSAAFDFDAHPGAIQAGWQGGGRLAVDGGRLSLRYRRDRSIIDIAPSHMMSGASRVTLTGAVGVPKRPGQPWSFDIAGVDGVLSDEALGLPAKPIEVLRLRGDYHAEAGTALLQEARLKVDGGEVAVSGTISTRNSAGRTALKGTFSPMSSAAFIRMWPSIVVPAMRRWSGTNIKSGRLASGTFTLEDGRATVRPGIGMAGLDRLGADKFRFAMSLVGEKVTLLPRPGFAQVTAARVLMRLDNQHLEVVAPEAVIATSRNRRLPLKGVRLVSSDLWSPAATATVTLRAQGALPAALDLLPTQTRDGRPVKLPGQGIDGKIDANIRLEVPLGADLAGEDVKVTGSGRVSEGKARNVIGNHDVNGATVTFDLSGQSLDAKGQILVDGVGATLTYGRIFAAADADQPPLVLRATLDTADRAQLKLNINDLVQGDVPVEIKVTGTADGASKVELSADLGNAELVIESMAWKKPAGRAATLVFEAVDAGGGRTELKNFRVTGEDVALNGSMSLDKANRVVAFAFPELSLNVISRLQAEGRLRNTDVWDVKVRGQTFDGRNFFRSLFSVGQIRDTPLPPGSSRSGLELDAQIDNVLGYHDLSLKSLRMKMSKRGGQLVGLQSTGIVTGKDTTLAPGASAPGKSLDVTMEIGGQPVQRHLVARSDDAGQVFRLIGFYPSMQGGQMRLDVNLDGRGAAEKTGLLQVRQFNVLGDPVAYEPPISEDSMAQSPRPKRIMQRPVLPFESMRAPFSVGYGQFVIEDADLRGPVLGVVLKGKADFRTRFIDLGGTYVPLQGINSVVGNFPILGQLLAGPRGEGVIGMTFAIKGPMQRPQVLVNPVSFGLPGILREMMQMTNPTPRVTPRDIRPTKPRRKGTSVRSTSKSTDAPTHGNPKIDPNGGWSSRTVPAQAQ